MGDQCLLRYESYERAKPLLEAFNELSLDSENKNSNADDDEDKKHSIMSHNKNLKSEEKPLSVNDDAKLDMEKDIIS